MDEIGELTATERLLYNRLIAEGVGWDPLGRDWGDSANNLACKAHMYPCLVFHRCLTGSECDILSRVWRPVMTQAELWAIVREAIVRERRSPDSNGDCAYNAYRKLVGMSCEVVHDHPGCGCGSQKFVVFFDGSSWCDECLLPGPTRTTWDWPSHAR